MSSYQSGSSRSQNEGANPLESFEQLVTPSPHQVSLSSHTIDTRAEKLADGVIVSSSLAVESLDDVLAEEFPLYEMGASRQLRDAVELFIATILEEVSRDFFLDSQGEFSAERRISFRYGPARLSAIQAPLAWVECRCSETEAYILPKVSQLMSGVKWLSDNEHRLPERFHDGPVRLMLELDPKTFEVARCRPLVSPQCAVEAESNFLLALRQGERADSSYLLSQYHDLLVERGVQFGELSADSREDERRAYINSLPRPRISSVTTMSNGALSLVVAYREADGGGFNDSIVLESVSPWGLHVRKFTRSPLTPVP